MKLIQFPEVNSIVAKHQPEYLPAPAHVADDGRLTLCWKLTWRERLTLLFRGLIWHQVLTFKTPLQPQRLTLDKPEL